MRGWLPTLLCGAFLLSICVVVGMTDVDNSRDWENFLMDDIPDVKKSIPGPEGKTGNGNGNGNGNQRNAGNAQGTSGQAGGSTNPRSGNGNTNGNAGQGNAGNAQGTSGQGGGSNATANKNQTAAPITPSTTQPTTTTTTTNTPTTTKTTTTTTVEPTTTTNPTTTTTTTTTAMPTTTTVKTTTTTTKPTTTATKPTTTTVKPTTTTKTTTTTTVKPTTTTAKPTTTTAKLPTTTAKPPITTVKATTTTTTPSTIKPVPTIIEKPVASSSPKYPAPNHHHEDEDESQPTAEPAEATTAEEKEGLSTEMIIGIVIGCVLVFIVAPAVLCFCVVRVWKKKKRRPKVMAPSGTKPITSKVQVPVDPKGQRKIRPSKQRSTKKKKRAKKPKQMDCYPMDQINKDHFRFVGPLRMDSHFKGEMRHELDGVKSHSLKDIEFDEALNEVVDIGSDIEIIEPSAQTTLTTTAEDSTAIGGTLAEPAAAAAAIAAAVGPAAPANGPAPGQEGAHVPPPADAPRD